MNVVICDHHRLFAESLASVIDARGWTIVGTPADPAHAVAVVARTHVDVCLMDLVFPDGTTGVSGIAAVRAVSPTTKVVVLTATTDPELIMRAVQSGADGIVFKDDDIDRIIEVAEEVVNEPNETRSAPEKGNASRNTTPPLTGTSERSASRGRSVTGLELEMLDRLLRGERGKALAHALGISYSSARTRIQNLLEKLGAHSGLEAIAFAADDDPRRPPPSAGS